MSELFDGLNLKKIGDFKSYTSLDSSLELIARKEIDPKKAYSFFSLELDSIAAETGLDPSKLLAKCLMDEENRILRNRMRSRIRGELKNNVAPEMFETLLDTVFALDIIKKLIKDAGSARNTLSHAAKTLSIEKSQIMLSNDRLELFSQRIDSPFMVREALGLIRDVYGEAANDILTLQVTATCGILLGVRNRIGNLVGVAEFISDRGGDISLLNMSIARGWEGYGVFEKAVEGVLQMCPRKRIWTVLEKSDIAAYMPYLKEGFRMGRYLSRYTGKKDHILFEKIQGLNDSDAPFLPEPDYGLDRFQIPADAIFDQKNALENKCFTVRLSSENKFRALLFERAFPKEPHNPPKNEWRHSDSGLTFFTTEDPKMVHKASQIEKRFHGPVGEEEHSLFSIATRGYLALSKDDDGGLASEAGLVLDMQNGIFCHGVATGPQINEIEGRKLMMKYVEWLARKRGISRVWTTADTMDYPVLESNINGLGYSGNQLFLDYYGAGKHRMLIEKDITAKTPQFNHENARLKFIDTFTDFAKDDKNPDAYVIPCTNYALLMKMLERGYRVVRMLKPEEYPDEGTNPKKRNLLVVAG